MVYKRIVLIILLVGIGVCFLKADGNFSPEEQWATPHAKHYLSLEMIQTYTDKANKGDGDATYRLGMFYNTLGSDRMKAIYWFEKGIQLDNMGCLFEFGAMFVFSNIEQRRIIALQCFNPIIQEAENGNEDATSYVDKLPDDIKEAAKNVDNIPDEIKEAAAKEMDKLLDEIKKEVEESNE